MSIAYLKVKIKSLAVEASIIRHEERKWLRSGRWLRKHNPSEMQPVYNTWAGLNTHRHDLRLEQRAAYLAYGYLRGTPYQQIEQAPHWRKPPYSRQGPNWGRVRDLVIKYGRPVPADGKSVVLTQLEAWRKTPAVKAA